MNSKNNLAWLYVARQKYNLAVPLYREAIEAGRKHWGLEHPHMQTMFRSLIECYEKMGQPAQGELLLREQIEFWKKKAGADAPRLKWLSRLGVNLLKQKKGAEAEPVLLECLAMVQQKEPKAWTTFAFHSLLGEALLVQKKYAAAEPLLVQGYEGLEQQAMKIPPQLRQTVLIQALQRLVHLCEATGQKHQAQAWRKKLEAVQQAKPVNK